MNWEASSNFSKSQIGRYLHSLINRVIPNTLRSGKTLRPAR